MNENIALIQVNKCVVGDDYYLDGMWYNLEIPMINTKVKFIGRDKTISNIGKSWDDQTGQFIFQADSGFKFNAYARNTMLLNPIDDPEILTYYIKHHIPI